MDLSKLWFEKEIDPNSVNAMEAIRKHHKDKNAAVENLKAVSVPSYCYRFDFYTYARDFTEKREAYKGQTNIPSPTGDFTPRSFSFDAFPLRDISFENDFDKEFDTTSIIVKTQKLYSCPDCGGDGTFQCKSCGGKGKGTCPSCGGNRFRKCDRCKGTGWYRCWKCEGKKGINQPYGWEECKICYGKGEIRCEKCGNKGEIRCERCHSTGIATCQQCGGNGYEKCKSCEGTGKMVKYIAMHDFNYVIDKYVIQHHTTISKSLKRFLEGKEDSFINDMVERMLTFESSVPIIESIDSPFDIPEVLNGNETLSIRDEYNSFYDVRPFEWTNDRNPEDRSVGKTLKVRTRIYQLNVIRVSYKYDDNDCELWLYGKDNTLFEEKDLKRLLKEEKRQAKLEAEREKNGSDSDGEESDDDEILAESPKRRLFALLFAVFMGVIGGHRFYAGRIFSGILQMVLFCVMAAFNSTTEGSTEIEHPVLGKILAAVYFIWFILDFVKVCTGKFKDKYGAVIKNW